MSKSEIYNTVIILNQRELIIRLLNEFFDLTTTNDLLDHLHLNIKESK